MIDLLCLVSPVLPPLTVLQKGEKFAHNWSFLYCSSIQRGPGHYQNLLQNIGMWSWWQSKRFSLRSQSQILAAQLITISSTNTQEYAGAFSDTNVGMRSLENLHSRDSYHVRNHCHHHPNIFFLRELGTIPAQTEQLQPSVSCILRCKPVSFEFLAMMYDLSKTLLKLLLLPIQNLSGTNSGIFLLYSGRYITKYITINKDFYNRFDCNLMMKFNKIQLPDLLPYISCLKLSFLPTERKTDPQLV